VLVLPLLEVPSLLIGAINDGSLSRICFTPSLEQHDGVFLGPTSLIEVARNLGNASRLLQCLEF
jgi:hypothetical protein